MFAIMMASLPFLSGSITAFASYYTAAFFQAFLHRLLGHHKIGGKLFTVHTGSHHTIYSGDRMLMDDYAPEEKSLSAIFVLPAILVTLLAYWALPVRLFIISVITLAISFAVHIYVHAQYHLTNTRLARFEWFRTKAATALRAPSGSPGELCRIGISVGSRDANLCPDRRSKVMCGLLKTCELSVDK